jgi:hypothetical protein
MANTKQAAVPDAFDPNGLAHLTTLTADAQAAIAKLESQREKLAKRRAAHESERSRIAYAARAQGDQDASKRLSEMTSEAIRHEHELRDIEAALAVAREHLQKAEEDESQHADRQRAREVRAVAERMLAAGQAIDDALEVLVAAGDDLHKAADALHMLDCPTPTGQQLLSFGERAIRAAVQKTIWSRAIERLSPSEQCTFAGVIQQWAVSIERRFGESERTETEAA